MGLQLLKTPQIKNTIKHIITSGVLDVSKLPEWHKNSQSSDHLAEQRRIRNERYQEERKAQEAEWRMKKMQGERRQTSKKLRMIVLGAPKRTPQHERIIGNFYWFKRLMEPNSRWRLGQLMSSLRGKVLAIPPSQVKHVRKKANSKTFFHKKISGRK